MTELAKIILLGTLVVLFISVNALFLVWMERKVSARIQLRRGPLHVGWEGLLQTVADAVKLLSKELTLPKEGDKFLYLLAPVLVFVYAMIGLSLGSIFMVFTHTSIVRVFFITAGTFAAMSLYGYTTKRDLTGFGSFLFMGLIGIILASLVNLFLQSSGLHFVISIIGVGVFVGLTAFDTQKIKSLYAETDHDEVHKKKAIMGALTLYLDFINLFLMLIRLIGDRR